MRSRSIIPARIPLIVPMIVDERIVAAAAANPQRQFPASAAAWSAAFPGITAPIHIWTFQESASPIDDKVGTADLVENQALLYAQTGDTEPTDAPRVALQFDTTNTTEWTGPASSTVGNIAAGANFSLYLRCRIPDTTTTGRSVVGKGASGLARWAMRLNATTGTIRWTLSDAVTTVNVTSVSGYDDNAFHDVLLVYDNTANVSRLITESENLSADASALNAIEPLQGLRFGATDGISVLAGTQISYAAMFNVALTAANLATIRTEQ